MTLLTPRCKTLCQATIRKFLEGAVNPSEAKGLFHDIDVRHYARRGSLAPAHDNPTLLLLGVILLQPSPKLRTF
jgi:hypothetical protein